MKFTWIGQGGFIFESEGVRLVVDPYLSNIVEQKEGRTRIMNNPVSIKELRPDAIFCTHDHLDHFDPETVPEIIRNFSSCFVAGPESVGKKCAEFGIPNERFKEICKGESINIGPFKITAVEALHSDKCAVGAIIENNGKRIYLSGDSEYSDDLAKDVLTKSDSIDMVLICINGRLGNMNLQDALKTVESIAPTQALPMHYGLFAENTVDPQPFIKACNEAGIKSFEMIPGKEYEL
jgi:L-ascorbate metabolism protein UlaG (beta-lactamase superfamily)